MARVVVRSQMAPATAGRPGGAWIDPFYGATKPRGLAAAAATRGRSHRRPAATARRGCLVACEACAAAFATPDRRRPAPCRPAAAPGAPRRARPPAFAAARAARGFGRLRIPTRASLPARRRRTLVSGARGRLWFFRLVREGSERLTSLALRRARAAREHLGHHVVRLVVLVPRAARAEPLHPRRRGCFRFRAGGGGRGAGRYAAADAHQLNHSTQPGHRSAGAGSTGPSKQRAGSGPGASRCARPSEASSSPSGRVCEVATRPCVSPATHVEKGARTHLYASQKAHSLRIKFQASALKA